MSSIFLFGFVFFFNAESMENKNKHHSQKRELEIYCFIFEMVFSEVEPSLKSGLKVEVEEVEGCCVQPWRCLNICVNSVSPRGSAWVHSRLHRTLLMNEETNQWVSRQDFLVRERKRGGRRDKGF